MAFFNLELSQFILALVLALPLAYFFTTFKASKPLPDESEEPYRTRPKKTTNSNNAMAAPNPSGLTSPAAHINAPRLDLFTLEELKQYDGSGPEGKIYVSVKGTVFDVSAKKEMYGPGASYHVFAGKDASKGLGMSSTKPEDAVPDYSTLDAASMKTLDGWYEFFQKRYSVMGTVRDLPAAVSRF
ncbi:hypothetical protein M408DRAFT_327619 [Serendipita vermifera MAFF 305830]|uniref:Cytochrome b5 heme-binding domain-containing protein n=1 Tax=Serendipita vermifera MAFF 305830 TaxID=933852 RepID=A0A0C3B3J1_SERVB|nr:hypothetical protein M408DRAFT_327619 [Serendipita vermifera MAFF 305830]